MNLSVDGKDDGSFEVSPGELVLDSLDDLDGVFVLDFSSVGTCGTEKESQRRVESRPRFEKEDSLLKSSFSSARRRFPPPKAPRSWLSSVQGGEKRSVRGVEG